MRLIYKIGLYITGILLIFSILIAASYINYRSINNDNSLILVLDGLSINYINGNEINYNGIEKTYNFSITNNSTDTLRYYIEITDINSNKDNIKYSLVEKNNIININEKSFSNTSEEYLASYIEIESNTTHTYELKIYSNKHSTLEANIKVGLEDTSEDNFQSVLLNNNEIKTSSITKIGEEVATDNEGLIELNGDYGKLYYFRGNVPNNYVSYANLLWRIVKINSDGSIKLILNDYISDSGNFYSTDSDKNISEKLSFTSSEIYTVLQNWYQTNLLDYEDSIASTRYCTDDSVGQVSDKTYYLGYSRLLTDYYQTSSCLGTEITSKIGLLTADEAVMAGASKNSDNTSYYLYTAGKTQSWWTMTPATSNDTDITYFEISQNGLLKNESVGSFYRGIKPVINLIKKTYVSGDGTISNPYTIKE